MKEVYINYVAGLLSCKAWQVDNCSAMLEDGDTIPFISRYRKEKTGGLDDADVAEVKHYVDIFAEMEKRKATVRAALLAAGALTPELDAEINSLTSPTRLEDIYLPYKPHRRTRATVAREMGLEPLADMMWECRTADPRSSAKQFVAGSRTLGDKPGAEDVEAALAGARDIVAERLSETAAIRENLRGIYRARRVVSNATKAASSNPDAAKYRSYFNFTMPLAKIPSHNLLAILRAEGEGFLSVSIDAEAQRCEDKIYYDFCKAHRFPSPALAQQMKLAVADSYARLLDPSISSEVLREAKEKADLEAVRVFGSNLRELLLGAPVGEKPTMAIDPGFRNGCKIACLDAQGRLLHHEIIYPHPPQSDKIRSLMRLQDMIEQYGIQAIAIGNGTASRETEDFLRKVSLPEGCKVWTVSEDGASIYSASEAARREFPDEDVTVRGAVSIGRRLMDPLAELVKIDPKNLGVGQYQHDVDQNLLREKLQTTVESCVNSVGVNLNTASEYLLAYVAGIGPSLAAAIIARRDEKGAFRSRAELLEVPRLGPKAFKQCAGFLRIAGAANPLDNSAVHPESYKVVEKMAADLGVSVASLVGNAELCAKIDINRYVSEDCGLPTLKDIVAAIEKPGRDPRSEAVEFSFDDSVRCIEDLKAGMELPGIVTNITAFGAFVDIGLHENGLLHVSRLGPRGTDPSKVLHLHQQIKVSVLDVDLERKRIALGLVK